MVYNEIDVIAGEPLNFAELMEFLKDKYDNSLIKRIKNMKEDEDDSLCEEIYNLRDNFSHNGKKIYTFACCSPLNMEIYIVGEEVKTIKRISPLSCEDCTPFPSHTGLDGVMYSCDKCLGTTNEGWFDVQKIHDSIVQLTDEQIENLGLNKNGQKYYFLLNDCLSCS